jgi:hypothetical protein
MDNVGCNGSEVGTQPGGGADGAGPAPVEGLDFEVALGTMPSPAGIGRKKLDLVAASGKRGGETHD